MKRILIVGASTKAGLSISRSLNRYGYEIDVIDWENQPIRNSRYIKKVINVGNPLIDVKLFLESLLKFLEKNKYEALIPLHDSAIEICKEYQNEISKYIKVIGINSDEIIKYSSDKYELLSKAKEFGIEIPNGFLIKSISDFEEIKNKLEFPIAAKPVSSAKIISNRLVSFKVKFFNNIEQLTDFIREHISNVNILLQEFVEGYGIGYNFISKNGEVYNSYIHRRIFEHKGISSYRESLTPDSYSFDENIKKFIKELNWTGVAMIEFKIKPNGTPVLMEMNGRFFGSTEVAIKSNLNLPVLFFEMLCLNKEIPKNLPIKHAQVRIFHDEFQQKLLALFQLKFKQFFIWLFSLLNIFRSNNFIEDNLFKDPGFVVALYFADIKRNFNKHKNKIKKVFISIETPSKSLIEKSKTIAFICMGNICRSPFAEYYAKKNISNKEFFSFGYVSETNRLSPTNAVLASTKFGIDISEHKSKFISKTEIVKMDLFLIMDKNNYAQLIKLGVPKNKIYFLSNVEIKDPYNKDLKSFEETYTSISKSINIIFK